MVIQFLIRNHGIYLNLGFKIYEEKDIFCLTTLTEVSLLQVYIVFGTEGVHIHMDRLSLETSGKWLDEPLVL
jgi:hypothetical protein